MRFRKTSFLVAAIALIAGCAARADQTDPTTIDGLKGRTLRVVHPGEMITMDCRLDRVTIYVDADNRITHVNFC